MRRTFLPLACCLLMLLPALASTSAISDNFKSSKKLTLSKSTIKSTLKDKSPIEERGTVNKTLPEHKSTQNGDLRDDLTDGKKHGVFHIEEYSYNYAAAKRSTSNGTETIQQKTENSENKYSQATFANGMFYGFAIMVVLLNLICYFLFNENVFLFYSLSLVSIVNLLFFSDGLLPILGIGLGAESYMTEATLVLINCLFASWFAARYLNLSEVCPKLRFVSFLAFGSGIVLLALSYSIGLPALAAISNILSFGVVTAHFGVGMFLFSSKNYPKFYVIAYFIPLLFAVDYFVFRNIGYEFLLTQPGHLKAAVLVEMLLLSYAIMYRMKAIKEENELRQTELRIFLKRQEMMNRKTAMQLMEDVYLENLIMHYDLDGFEIKLLQYISEGKDNAKIARKLKTTESEIEELTKELYQKLEIGEHIKQDYRMVDAQPDYIYN